MELAHLLAAFDNIIFVNPIRRSRFYAEKQVGRTTYFPFMSS
jgi:hypothetical protein